MSIFSGWTSALDRGWTSGWRRSAIVNVGLMSTCMVMLIGILAAAIEKTGNVAQAWSFYTADCNSGRASLTNTMLHLLLNVVSTIILASSNFFMQVVNAPSRREVDVAHAKGDWLDIGIPSFRNAIRLSPFKTMAWLVLFFTSIPIHMFFNSSVFQMDHRIGDYQLTIATEAFVQGGTYFPPGATLYTKDVILTQSEWQHSSFRNPDYLLSAEDYHIKDAPLKTVNISNAAAAVAMGWEKLNLTKCLEMYRQNYCNGLAEYHSVIMITEGSGWQRSHFWNLSESANTFWEPIVPEDETNNLWFSAQCHMKGRIDEGSIPSCITNCDGFLSGYHLETRNWQLRIGNWLGSTSATNNTWQPNWNTSIYSTPKDDSVYGLTTDLPGPEIAYCLAEPRDYICAVALSKPLLLAVVLSVLVKVLTCVVIILVLGASESLVTPGDAVASFISVPDSKSQELGLTTHDLVRAAATRKTDAPYVQVGPRQWADEPVRRASCVPRKVWISTYSILVFGGCAAIASFVAQLRGSISLGSIAINPMKASRVLSPVDNGVAFISSVLIANLPQLYLSFWYLAYNSLVTRLEMAREWALLSTRYRGLRVTFPKGKQMDTYRLQLPYKYSVSLIVASIVLHWLLSNALFVIVSQGNYYEMSTGRGIGGYRGDAISLPPDAVVGLVTLATPVFAIIIIGSLMMIVPLIIATEFLPGYMPCVGSNSLAMAAACHVSPLAKVPADNDDEEADQNQDSGQDVELQELVPSSRESFDDKGRVNSEVSNGDIACSKLKWGEVTMPQEWHDRVEIDGQATERVGHLSFGTVLDDPQPPIVGRWYM